MRGALAIALLVALAASGCGGGGGARSPEPARPPAAEDEQVHWLAPNGSDAAAGTRAAPWRTIEAALNRAGAGSTLMLRPGTYGARGGTLAIDADDVTVTGAPGAERPSVLGAVLVRGDRVRLRHLLFNGPTGPVLERTEENPDGEEVQVAIEGDGVEVSDCEVRDNRWHAGIYLSGAEDVRLLANHIHHNGAFGRSEQANLDHGIYFGSGSGLVANNVVEKNLAHGVQLYPRARGVVVAFNTIARNGKAGVILAEEAADNLVVSNLIVANGDNSIRSSDLEGSGNVARRNLVWANGSGNLGADATNLLIEDNIQADPLLDGEYRPRDKSPALDAGERVPGVERDRDGVPRPQGEGPDLGAYERE